MQVVQGVEVSSVRHTALSWGQRLNLLAIPLLGQMIQTLFCMLLMFGFSAWFASIAVTDQAIEAWLGVKPRQLSLFGADLGVNAVVFKVTLIVSVFAG